MHLLADCSSQNLHPAINPFLVLATDGNRLCQGGFLWKAKKLVDLVVFSPEFSWHKLGCNLQPNRFTEKHEIKFWLNKNDLIPKQNSIVVPYTLLGINIYIPYQWHFWVDDVSVDTLQYGWWFRNPKQPPKGCFKNLANNGINDQPQLVQDFFHQLYLLRFGVLWCFSFFFWWSKYLLR